MPFRAGLIFLMSSMVALCACAEPDETAPNPLDAFPEAAPGMKRLMIELPGKARGDDENFRVELIPGRTQTTDGVNLLRLDARLEPRPLEGWGYTYYDLQGSDRTISTLMAVPEGTAAREAFVAGEALMIRYNSRLPIVIYAPETFEVRYRIWSAGDAEAAAEG